MRSIKLWVFGFRAKKKTTIYKDNKWFDGFSRCYTAELLYAFVFIPSTYKNYTQRWGFLMDDRWCSDINEQSPNFDGTAAVAVVCLSST